MADKHLLCVFVWISMAVLMAGCATHPPPQRVEQVAADVYFGGVRLLAPKTDDIPVLFPSLSNKNGAGIRDEAQKLNDIFREKRNAFTRINLKGFDGDLGPDNATIMACAFTGERFSSETAFVDDKEISNVRAYLGGALLLQNFSKNAEGLSDISFLACYPFSITAIGLRKSGESLKKTGGRLLLGDELGLQSESFSQIISALAPKVAPVTGLGATMQVRKITTTNTASFLNNKFSGNEGEFKHWLAGELGEQLAIQIGIPMIPYAENTATRKLAVMMENGSAYDISLPEPVYAINFELEGFSRVEAESNVAESLWIYGAYAKCTIYEPQTGKVRWDRALKAGVPKIIAATQTVIDHEVAEFEALLKLLQTLPEELTADKSARALLESCLK